MFLIIFSLSWVLGIILGLSFNIPFPMLFSGLIPFLLIPLFKKIIMRLLLVSFCLLIFWGAALYAHTTIPSKSILDSINKTSEIQLKGHIGVQPEMRDKVTHFELSVTELKIDTTWYTTRGTILVILPRYPKYKYGDKLYLSGKLEYPTNFGDFDYQAYLARNDIFFIMYSPHIEILDHISKFNFRTWIYNLRDRLSESLAVSLPESQASLAQGIVLGIRSTMSASLKNQLSITGTAHILAISGINLSIVAGLLISLGILILGRKHYIYVWIALFMIWFYVLLTGMQSPVIRAAIMASIFLLAELFGRQKNVLVALILSAAIMVGINPHIIFEISFQLSFTAMIGLVLISPIFQKLSRKAIDKIFKENVFATRIAILVSDSLCITLGAIAAVWPIIAFNFKIFSVIGPLATLLISPVLVPIIVLGTVTAIIGLLSQPVAQIIGWTSWLFLSYMIWLISAFASLPFAALAMEKISTILFFVYYSILAMTIWIKANLTKINKMLPLLIKNIYGGFIVAANSFSNLSAKLVTVPLLIIFFTMTYHLANLPESDLHVSILDVGEGDSILIQNGYQNIIIDGGPSPQAICLGLSSKLTFWNRNIDMIILTHPHLDHLCGLIEVLKRYDVKQILMFNQNSTLPAYKEWLDLIATKNIPCNLAQIGQKINLSNYAELEILNPDNIVSGEYDNDIDNNAVIVRLSKEQISFLFTADINHSAEIRMLQQRAIQKTTVLKIAHHGSDTSTSGEFLDVVKPVVAAISSGSNNTFGHPDEQVLERLRLYLGNSSNIYRTDQSGTIEFTTDGKRLWIKTEK